MDYVMYIIGAIIFGLYMSFTIWNIIYNNNKQEEENKATTENDILDHDEMGNFSSFPTSKEIEPDEKKSSYLKKIAGN